MTDIQDWISDAVQTLLMDAYRRAEAMGAVAISDPRIEMTSDGKLTATWDVLAPRCDECLAMTDATGAQVIHEPCEEHR